MQTTKEESKYYTNSKIKAKIDKLLHKNSIVQSNLGRESTQEDKDLADIKIKEIAHDIHSICPTFAKETFIEIEFNEVL